MSVLFQDVDKEYSWCQYALWVKSTYWATHLDEVLKTDDTTSMTSQTSVKQNLGMLEAALLSEKVYMYTINDCVYSNVQTEIFATLLPSELINQYPLEGKTRSHFVGVLVFGDVSGFTALCEKYFAEGGKGGTYKLTATLNSYIGAMVDVIYSYGGDIIKFSGDAFLAVWRVKKNDYISEVIHKVIVCTMYIQYSLGSFETDANVLLRVKLAISAGNVVFSSIGDETSKYYVIYGHAVDEVKEAQDTCVSGDVVLAPSAWGHISHVNYLFSFKDEKHIKILRIIYNPMQTNRKVFNLPPRHIVDLEKKYRQQIMRFKQMESLTDLNSAKFETVRPEVRTAAQRQLGPLLRAYLIPPVVAQVDAEQPLEYLTEMRLVTTVFINVVLDKKGTIETINRVDEVYTQIWQVVHKQMGVVNKVCMFDKDIMFLVIFGLRGAHHEYNAMRSLKCAYKIRTTISQLPHVKGIACGVTVGMTYCGVVGHPLRQEYTVIGAPVNKAARLMMYFPNKVTCDQQTFFNSGLSPIYFTEQERKYLKGIGQVGGIYEYSEGKRGAGNVNIYQLPPLLGRDTELQTFKRVIDAQEGFPCGVLYCGDKGVGKTRLLEEFQLMCVNLPYRTTTIALQTNHSTINYYTIQQIFKNVFNFPSNEEIKSRTDKISALLSGTEYAKYVVLLNKLLSLNVTETLAPELLELNSNEINKLREKTFQKLVEKACSGFLIFIDNIEFCDKKSSDYLQFFLQDVPSGLIMTVNKKSYSKPRRYFKNCKLIIYQLEDLDEEFVAPLACQLLGVRAIPSDLEKLIIVRSSPNPGWCQRFLQSLLDSKTMIIEKVQRKSLESKENMVIPDLALLTKRIIGQEYRPLRITFVQTPPPVESFDDEVNICTIVCGDDQVVEEMPGSMEAVIMSAFDRLSPFEQLLLKCGSVIGNEFSREMLHAVLFKRSPKETAQAIKRLFEMHLLCCGKYDETLTETNSQDDNRSIEASLGITKLIEVACHCKVRTIHDDFEEAYLYPYYAFCNYLKFTLPVFRRKTYDLLPLNQKMIFHKRIAAFLELKLHPPEDLKPEAYPGSIYWTSFLQAMTLVIQQISTDSKDDEKREKRPQLRKLIVYREERFDPSLFKDIIYHYHVAGLIEREVLLMIEYCESSLLAGCSRRTINGMNMAEERLMELKKKNKLGKNYDFNYVIAKIAIVKAQAYLEMQFTALARKELKKAQYYLFGNKLMWFLYKRSKPTHCSKLISRLYASPLKMFIRNKNPYCTLRADFFNKLTNVYMNEKDWNNAKKSSTRAILSVLKSKDPGVILIYNTFANMIDVHNHLGEFKNAKIMRIFARKLISNKELEENNILQEMARARLETAVMTTCIYLRTSMQKGYLSMVSSIKIT